MFRSQTVNHQEDFLSPTSNIRWIDQNLGPCSDYGTGWIFRGLSPGRCMRFSVFAKASGSALEPSGLVFSGYRRLFDRDKVAGAWNWPLTSIQYCRGQERVEPYLCSSCIPYLHGQRQLLGCTKETTQRYVKWDPIRKRGAPVLELWRTK